MGSECVDTSAASTLDGALELRIASSSLLMCRHCLSSEDTLSSIFSQICSWDSPVDKLKKYLKRGSPSLLASTLGCSRSRAPVLWSLKPHTGSLLQPIARECSMRVPSRKNTEKICLLSHDSLLAIDDTGWNEYPLNWYHRAPLGIEACPKSPPVHTDLETAIINVGLCKLYLPSAKSQHIVLLCLLFTQQCRKGDKINQSGTRLVHICYALKNLTPACQAQMKHALVICTKICPFCKVKLEIPLETLDLEGKAFGPLLALDPTIEPQVLSSPYCPTSQCLESCSIVCHVLWWRCQFLGCLTS